MAAPGVPLGPSMTECRAVGPYIGTSEGVAAFANFLRAMCTSYSTFYGHTVVLRAPMPAVPGAPPSRLSTLLHLTRRMPHSVAAVAPGRSPPEPETHPFLEPPPDR
jgi:hypothetical protein